MWIEGNEVLLGGERSEAAELWQKNAVSECPSSGGVVLVWLSLPWGTGAAGGTAWALHFSNWALQLPRECWKWNKVELCQLHPLTWK